MAWRNNKNIEELLSILDNKKEIIVFDLETTGLSRKTDYVIQFSGIKYTISGGKLEEKEVVDTYIKPEKPIPAKISEITGITNEMVKNSPTEKDAFEKIIKPFFGDSPVLAGYNSRTFDIPMMKALYERQKSVFEPDADTDVMRLSKDFLVNEELKDKKLSTVAHHYGVDVGLTFHNSLDDVRATARLLMLYNEKAKKIAEEKARNRAFKLKPKVNKVLYWQGYRGHSRVYIQTNYGDFYYDAYNKQWGLGKSNIYSLEEINMEQLQKDVWALYGATSDEEMFNKVKKAATA